MYAKTVGDQYGVAVQITMFDGPRAAGDLLRRKEVDLLNVPPTYLSDLDEGEVEGPYLVSRVGSSIFDEYLLLTRAAGPVKTVTDLRGRSVIVANDLRSSLAQVWLDVLLHERGLGSRAMLGGVAVALTPSQAVLPVFFGKRDACVVTRDAWKLLGELNPQVETQLRPIAVSQPLVSGLAIFRRGIEDWKKQKILKVITSTQRTASFQQVLTLYKITNVVVQPPSVLDSTRALLASYRRLAEGHHATRPARPKSVARRGP
jgi:ABC transporter, phosphonate, periplasmic substrate-binding protein